MVIEYTVTLYIERHDSCRMANFISTCDAAGPTCTIVPKEKMSKLEPM